MNCATFYDWRHQRPAQHGAGFLVVGFDFLERPARGSHLSRGSISFSGFAGALGFPVLRFLPRQLRSCLFHRGTAEPRSPPDAGSGLSKCSGAPDRRRRGRRRHPIRRMDQPRALRLARGRSVAGFQNSVLAISGVSGGSVGAMFYLRCLEAPPDDDSPAIWAQNSSLEAVAWGLTHPDLRRIFIPGPETSWSRADRGWALERSLLKSAHFSTRSGAWPTNTATPIGRSCC